MAPPAYALAPSSRQALAYLASSASSSRPSPHPAEFASRRHLASRRATAEGPSAAPASPRRFQPLPPPRSAPAGGGRLGSRPPPRQHHRSPFAPSGTGPTQLDPLCHTAHSHPSTYTPIFPARPRFPLSRCTTHTTLAGPASWHRAGGTHATPSPLLPNASSPPPTVSCSKRAARESKLPRANRITANR
ncbi:hypothetical protein CALCODRAFT_266139 [Calocera cornea HHB12733]|uniref:Uncharacterized protein n=1 Tax=Calocera cornea HHB12733 TaxID=1353952 RepID=A0A165GAI7_9BASI|nr:hypothetical protein CALCODRAFT_266139 [Calocera cornea HHB12733]